MTRYPGVHDVLVAAAREAGDILRRDFHRPGGPRGKGDKAEADVESEVAIRSRLRHAFPDYGYLGEETGREAGRPGAPVFVVDPNDGTRDYLKGARGSAVSIGLIHERRPVAGVVYSFGYPDDHGDLFSWAEGMETILRNGEPVRARVPKTLGPGDVVLVSSSGYRDPASNLRCSEPARFRTIPSIAHRLALVASGEGSATSSLYGPVSWDFAAGHALIRVAGGVLVDEAGREIGYDDTGWARLRTGFGGGAEVARLLAKRPWGRPRIQVGVDAPLRLDRGRAVRDPDVLGRAQGCLLGQIAGDNLGAFVEGARSSEVARLVSSERRHLRDGGRWNLLAGQPSDDSEMALVLARSIVSVSGYDVPAASRAYRAWLQSKPPSVGAGTRAGVAGRLSKESLSNSSLMRASPLGIVGFMLPPSRRASLAREDSRLTHPNAVCADAVAAYAIAIARAVRRGEGPRAAYDAARTWAEAAAVPAVQRALAQAEDSAPPSDVEEASVLVALHTAFYALLHASSVEDGVLWAVGRGGHTDTLGAVTGALLGAVHGRPAIPDDWRRMILSCRPHRLRSLKPRPTSCWPIDVLELAERLLLVGEERAAAEGEG